MDKYTDNLYWESVRQEIYSRRSEHEAEIDKIASISLSREDQLLSQQYRDREKEEFAAALGYKKGSYVVNSKGEHFKVGGMIDGSGMLKMDSLSVYLYPEYGEGFSLYTRTANVFHLTERNYLDQYTPDPDYIPSMLFLGRRSWII